MPTGEVFKVSADPQHKSCAFCNEKFDEHWDHDEDEWMFYDAILVPHEDKRLAGDRNDPTTVAEQKTAFLSEKEKVDAKYNGQILHVRCYQGLYEGMLVPDWLLPKIVKKNNNLPPPLSPELEILPPPLEPFDPPLVNLSIPQLEPPIPTLSSPSSVPSSRVYVPLSPTSPKPSPLRPLSPNSLAASVSSASSAPSSPVFLPRTPPRPPGFQMTRPASPLYWENVIDNSFSGASRMPLPSWGSPPPSHPSNDNPWFIDNSTSSLPPNKKTSSWGTPPSLPRTPAWITPPLSSSSPTWITESQLPPLSLDSLSAFTNKPSPSLEDAAVQKENRPPSPGLPLPIPKRVKLEEEVVSQDFEALSEVLNLSTLDWLIAQTSCLTETTPADSAPVHQTQTTPYYSPDPPPLPFQDFPEINLPSWITAPSD